MLEAANLNLAWAFPTSQHNIFRMITDKKDISFVPWLVSSRAFNQLKTLRMATTYQHS